MERKAEVPVGRRKGKGRARIGEGRAGAPGGGGSPKTTTDVLAGLTEKQREGRKAWVAVRDA